MKYPKVFIAKSRNITAGINRIIGQSALMAVYATFDEQSPAERKESRKTGCFRVKGKTGGKKFKTATPPRALPRQTNFAGNIPNEEYKPTLQDKHGNALHKITFGNDEYFISLSGMPS